MNNIPPNGNGSGFIAGVANTGKKVIAVGNFCVTNTDAFNKASKVALSIIGFLNTVFSQFVSGAGAFLGVLSKLKMAPEAAVSLTNATGIIERIFEFTDAKKRQEISKTPQKLIARITLTAGQALETVGFLNASEIVKIGAFNSMAMGKLSIFTLVKNVFISISSAFSIWDSAISIKKENSNQARTKLQDWTGKQQDALDQHIRDKNDKYDAKLDTTDLQAYKVEKYTKIVNNSNKSIKKAWVNIASEIAKLAIIAISSVALMFLIATPVSMVVIGAVGLVAASLGLVKTLYGEFGPKPEAIPQNPCAIAA